jgi:hypothetical protein
MPVSLPSLFFLKTSILRSLVAEAMLKVKATWTDRPLEQHDDDKNNRQQQQQQQTKMAASSHDNNSSK